MARSPLPIINIIELDARDARYQTGIARYFDVLGAHMPENVRTFRIICEFSPDFNDIYIARTDDGVHVRYPGGFPSDILNNVIATYVGPLIGEMENRIVKCNCLGLMGLAYVLRDRMYCRTVGVLHCLPHIGGGAVPPGNPFFNMDYVISVCKNGIDYLNQVGNTRPVAVIYNGIDAPAVRKKSKSDDGVFRFVFPGGWAPHKGFAKIIPAIRRVAATHKIEVLVPGGGVIPDDVRREIADLPIVSCGLIPGGGEMDAIYARADCALFASLSEACSFAGIESMAHNLPIVSNDTPGLVEMFGRAARYAPMDGAYNIDVDAYAAHMTTMIENRRVRTRSAIDGYARYVAHYTATRMARETLDLYYRILGIKA